MQVVKIAKINADSNFLCMKIYLLERGCDYSSFKLSDWPLCYLLVSLICVCFYRCNERNQIEKKA